MSAPIYVSDASVILKWAFRSDEERDGDKALDLLRHWMSGGCEIILPSLWLFECGNVLGLKSPDNAGEIMGIFLEYRFRECEISGSVVAAALRIMRECNVSFYDAVYHAVALESGGVLITADAAYYRKAALQGRIMMLADFN